MSALPPPSVHIAGKDADKGDRMDLHEDKDKNLVTATFELPGLTKENVQIDVKDNVLSVSGESTVSSERDEKGYSVRERRFGKFARALPLPQGIKVCVSCSGLVMRRGLLTGRCVCSLRRSRRRWSMVS